MGNANVQAGQIIKFTYYRKPVKRTDDAGTVLTEQSNHFKEVFVLHPNWGGNLHGLDMAKFTPAEREVLQEIMKSENRGKQHRIPLVNDILRRMDPIEDIKNAMAFYTRFVKPFLKGKDAYRVYEVTRMQNTVIITKSEVRGEVYNAKPLFHKI